LGKPDHMETLLDALPRLNHMDPYQSWDWSAAKPKMWDVYRVELFPHYGQPCGIDNATDKKIFVSFKARGEGFGVTFPQKEVLLW